MGSRYSSSLLTMTTRQTVRKKLSYRLPVDAGNEEAIAQEVADLWEGFEWVTGPVMVAWVSKQFGTVQVWAISEEEGRGVIEHAMGHMGARDEDGVWRVHMVTNSRYGRVATVRATCASARSGASGRAPTVWMTNPSF